MGGGLRELGTPLVGEETVRTALLEDDLELNNVDLGKVGQRDLQAIIDAARLQSLHSNSPLRDKARGKNRVQKGGKGGKERKIEKKFEGAKKSRERGAKRKERGRGKK